MDPVERVRRHVIAALSTEICFAFFYQNSNCINSISHHQAIFHPIKLGDGDLSPWWCQYWTFDEIPIHCYRLKFPFKFPEIYQPDSNVIPFPGQSLKILNSYYHASAKVQVHLRFQSIRGFYHVILGKYCPSNLLYQCLVQFHCKVKNVSSKGVGFKRLPLWIIHRVFYQMSSNWGTSSCPSQASR